jgi:hypothetical protein
VNHPGPDFSTVDMPAARALAERGAFVELLLLPAEFGGQRVPRNILYVPPFVAEQKRRIDMNIIAELIRDGHAQRYSATPEYAGSSAVPIAIAIRAWDPKDFRAEIAIWGAALERAAR